RQAEPVLPLDGPVAGPAVTPQAAEDGLDVPREQRGRRRLVSRLGDTGKKEADRPEQKRKPAAHPRVLRSRGGSTGSRATGGGKSRHGDPVGRVRNIIAGRRAGRKEESAALSRGVRCSFGTESGRERFPCRGGTHPVPKPTRHCRGMGTPGAGQNGLPCACTFY